MNLRLKYYRFIVYDDELGLFSEFITLISGYTVFPYLSTDIDIVISYET